MPGGIRGSARGRGAQHHYYRRTREAACRLGPLRSARSYGGYGARLEFTTPAQPTEPDEPWEWAVTPKWRRAEGGDYAAFNVKGNTAQMDEKAVKLVCAAALASGTDRPLMLILDELGQTLDTMPYNEAPVIYGDDDNRERVALLKDSLESYGGPRPTMDSA